MKYVVDASVSIKWYVPEIYSPQAVLLLAPSNELFAPELLLLEFGNIAWKKSRRGEITDLQARNMMNQLLAAGVQIFSHDYLSSAALSGALQTGQTVYDWSYLALAVALNCEMVTADEKFYRALETTKLKRHLLFIADII
jgi:predicted nucleic acid-binding protein